MSHGTDTPLVKKQSYSYKVLLVGDANVGKSSIVATFTNNGTSGFSSVYAPTIGLDFQSHKMKIREKSMKLLFFDSSGQRKFKSVITNYFRGAHAVILVFDVTRKSSFDNLQFWIASVEEQVGDNITFVVLANKTDNDSERIVPKTASRSWALRQGFQYFEVSAKTGANVDQAFVSLGTSLLSKTLAQITPKAEYPDRRYDLTEQKFVVVAANAEAPHLQRSWWNTIFGGFCS
eukprot:TRINITY_DN2608_c0_g2_i1.p1 TRINITY_DN2608_c0_g2~~TRINITY_DN2608_c0_g2_i1.p1  ORF type:complete len:262 (+),score=33.76 TRINITY_DN2608_c0_g2_i1:90-788(+)